MGKAPVGGRASSMLFWKTLTQQLVIKLKFRREADGNEAEKVHISENNLEATAKLQEK